MFELAREYDIHVDLHIDSGHDPATMDNMLKALTPPKLAALVEEARHTPK